MYIVERSDLITLMFLAILSLPLVSIVFILRNRINNIGLAIDSYIERNRLLKIFLIVFLSLFIISAYLSKHIYYTHYSEGVVGDSFIHPAQTLYKKFFAEPKHYFNPFLPQILVKSGLSLKLINPQDVYFKEKIFMINTLPIRFFASLGLIFMFLLFRNALGFSFLKSFLACMFLGTTFVYWLWGIYNNAIGMALGLQVISIFFTIKAIKSGLKRYYFLSAIMTSLVSFAHIGSGYFSFASGLFMITHEIWQIYKKRSKALNLFIYLLTAAIMAGIFCFIMIKTYRVHPLGESATFTQILYYLSDPMVGGTWNQTDTTLKFLINVKENMITGTTHILGILIQLKGYEKIVVFMMFTCFLSLLASLTADSMKKTAKNFTRQIWYGVTLAVIILMFYTVRYPGMHYYSAAIVSNVYLFLLFLFSGKEGKKNLSGFNLVFLAILIVCMFVYNGFLSKSVYWGKDLRACSIYRKYDDLDKLSKGKKVYYLEYTEQFKDNPITSMRNHIFITDYYNKFSYINWGWTPVVEPAKLYSFMRKEKDSIFYAGEEYLKRMRLENKSKRIVTNKISIDGYDYYELSLK